MKRSWDSIAALANAHLDSVRKPVCLVDLREGGSPRDANKMLGAAYLLPDERWPLCPYCECKLSLLVQVAVADIAAVAPGLDPRGLLQFFCCLNTQQGPLGRGGPECNGTYGWDVMADCQLIRVVLPDGESADDSPPDYEEWENFELRIYPDGSTASREIVWIRQLDERPDFYDAEQILRRDLKLDIRSLAPDQDAVHQVLPRYVPSLPRFAKFGGWPVWLQEPKWPTCFCGRTMRLIISISPDATFGIWQDAHINVYYCEKHPQTFVTDFQNT